MFIRVRAFALVAMAGLTVISATCGSGDGTPPETPTAVRSPTPSDSGRVSWEDAVAKIEACEVISVGQTHAGDIEITLRDGSTLRGRQPKLDGILAIAGEASERCGFSISMWTE
jgi:hypothetical protein